MNVNENESWLLVPDTNNKVEISSRGVIRYTSNQKIVKCTKHGYFRIKSHGETKQFYLRKLLQSLFNLNHYCKICGSTNKTEFTTSKYCCNECQLKSKPYICQNCGDTDSNNFYSTNKNRCKKCCINKVKTRYHNLTPILKQEHKNRAAEWVNVNLIHYRLLSAKKRAEKKGFGFDLTDDFLRQQYQRQNGKCYYSGVDITLKSSRVNPISVASLDRINNDKGYTCDNVVWTSKVVNTMKCYLTVDEFYKLIEIVYHYHCSNF